MDLSRVFDLLVLGGGNAALCAAITARRAGLTVLIAESAPIHFRGGNSRHTRNLRCMHAAPTDVLTEQYTEDEFMTDLLRVTGGATNETLARMVVRASANAPARLRRVGVRLQPSLRGTLQLGRTNAFFLGGGKALMNSYYAAAERAGVDVRYDADVVGLEIRDGRFESATIREDQITFHDLATQELVESEREFVHKLITIHVTYLQELNVSGEVGKGIGDLEGDGSKLLAINRDGRDRWDQSLDLGY